MPLLGYNCLQEVLLIMILAHGKTKTVLPGPRENTVILETADVLTGGDAAKKETIAGIGVHKTTQAANVFTLLNAKGLSTAFIRRESPNRLLCHRCEMLPLELVMRRYAWGTCLLRHPAYRAVDGRPYRFPEVQWEVFHKWAVVVRPLVDEPRRMPEDEARDLYLRDGVWPKSVYTDPYVQTAGDQWCLYPPKEDLATSQSLMCIEPLLDRDDLAAVVDEIMLPAFKALEEAWGKVVTAYGPVELVDVKIEIGRRSSDKKIVIADVIDNDSWRIWPGGDPARQLDKQCFRDDHPLSRVAENYALVAGLTGRFNDR